MTELGKSLIDEGKKRKNYKKIVRRAIKKGMDNEIIKELADEAFLELVVKRTFLA